MTLLMLWFQRELYYLPKKTIKKKAILVWTNYGIEVI